MPDRRDRRVGVLHRPRPASPVNGLPTPKATGRLGVCAATSGPGAIHLLNGQYDAKLDHVPVLAISGMQETSMLGTQYQQEVHPLPSSVQWSVDQHGGTDG
jgi:glyoxylate carboligase